jgi:hypothetical protein
MQPDDEDVYLVPASNEDALYSQLSEINVSEVPKASLA